VVGLGGLEMDEMGVVLFCDTGRSDSSGPGRTGVPNGINLEFT